MSRAWKLFLLMIITTINRYKKIDKSNTSLLYIEHVKDNNYFCAFGIIIHICKFLSIFGKYMVVMNIIYTKN